MLQPTILDGPLQEQDSTRLLWLVHYGREATTEELAPPVAEARLGSRADCEAYLRLSHPTSHDPIIVRDGERFVAWMPDGHVFQFVSGKPYWSAACRFIFVS